MLLYYVHKRIIHSIPRSLFPSKNNTPHSLYPAENNRRNTSTIYTERRAVIINMYSRPGTALIHSLLYYQSCMKRAKPERKAMPILNGKRTVCDIGQCADHCGSVAIISHSGKAIPRRSGQNAVARRRIACIEFPVKASISAFPAKKAIIRHCSTSRRIPSCFGNIPARITRLGTLHKLRYPYLSIPTIIRKT